jgi:hypothetical protein
VLEDVIHQHNVERPPGEGEPGHVCSNVDMAFEVGRHVVRLSRPEDPFKRGLRRDVQHTLARLEQLAESLAQCAMALQCTATRAASTGTRDATVRLELSEPLAATGA